MSTRAVISFRDERGTHHVYKHSDGYPSGLAHLIRAAVETAWVLPRFEADEFGAKFLYAGIQELAVTAREFGTRPSGGLRLTHGPECHGDLKWSYVVSCKEGDLWIVANRVSLDCTAKQVFAGRLAEFDAFARKSGH